MRNSKRIAIGIILLFTLMYFVSSSLAVPANGDDFIILGRLDEDSEGNSELVDEKIILRVDPDVDSMIQGRLESGTQLLVLDKTELETGTFYLVLKVGERGGIAGWVSEDYIYEVVSESQE